MKNDFITTKRFIYCLFIFLEHKMFIVNMFFKNKVWESISCIAKYLKNKIQIYMADEP